MKTTHWVTFQVPIEVKAEEKVPLAITARDYAWERLINPDEPPEGMVEHVAEGEVRPEILATNQLEKAA